VTGIDLVAWQLRIAAGQRLTVQQEDVQWTGHAIEVRINAEDPAANFRPSPGTITRFDVPVDGPQGPVRLDSHVRVGYRIPPQYDSMVGKLIVHGPTRAEAIERMQHVLHHTVIEGVPTTLPLHRAVLHSPAFVSGKYTCAFLAENPEVLTAPPASEENSHG